MPPLLHDALIDSVPLSFEQTVPRAWVHKRSLDNVLLTEIRSAAPDRFICAGQIPPGGDAARDSVAIEIRIPDLTRRKNNAVSRVVTEHTMWVGTHRVFDGTAAFTIQPAALFHRLRKATAA